MFKRQFAVILLATLLCSQFSCGGSSGTVGNGSRAPAPHFKPGINIFTPEQDIELGKESAAKVAQQVPLINDQQIVGYVRQLGARLAAQAPGYKFPYQFNVVATRDINAFALPGGFVFVNAGAIAAAKNEGELAGVMAHEISHVALRHPTNQVTKVYIAQKGFGILRRLGGSDHPDTGDVGNSIGGLGANMLFLKFGRTAERQADLEGAQIMAAAGYDPRDLAAFFTTLQEKGGSNVPEFLSDHPDPGNRIQSIKDELPSLQVSANPVHDSKEFEQVKARLSVGSSNIAASHEPQRTGPRDPNDVSTGERPAAPDTSLRQFQARDGSFTFQYPQNWDALAADDANMICAPKGAYGQVEDSLVVTQGIFIGAVAPKSNDLASATQAFVEQQIKMNPDFRVVRNPQAVNFGDRQGFATVVAGPSTVTGVVEVDTIYTTATKDGRLFYLMTIAPEDELKSYQPTFEQIVNSVRLAG